MQRSLIQSSRFARKRIVNSVKQRTGLEKPPHDKARNHAELSFRFFALPRNICLHEGPAYEIAGLPVPIGNWTMNCPNSAAKRSL